MGDARGGVNIVAGLLQLAKEVRGSRTLKEAISHKSSVFAACLSNTLFLGVVCFIDVSHVIFRGLSLGL